MKLLKQSTASTVVVGPVLDTNGAAVTTAVVGDFRLSKNGTTATLSGATVTHDANGYYTVALTTANTDTVGRLAIYSGNTAQSMATHNWTVLLATVFDAIVTNATNTTGGLATATGAISAFAGAISTYAGGAVASVTDPVTVGTNNDKTDYSLTVTPPTAAAVADAVWDEATSGHTTAGTYGGRIVRSTNSNVSVQITGSNHIAADVHEFQDDVLTSAATDTTFVTEVQSGLATSAALATVDGLVDLLVSRSGYQMSILAGAISNAQNAAESYSITLDGSTYSVTYSGLDASGNRSGATLVTT